MPTNRRESQQAADKRLGVTAPNADRSVSEGCRQAVRGTRAECRPIAGESQQAADTRFGASDIADSSVSRLQ